MLLQLVLAQETQWISAINEAGEEVLLADNRKPALYTGDFGDCLGSSIVNVTRFDAAYYKDNMTVTFHLTGNTAVNQESLMSEWPSIIKVILSLTISSVHRRLRIWRKSL